MRRCIALTLTAVCGFSSTVRKCSSHGVSVTRNGLEEEEEDEPEMMKILLLLFVVVEVGRVVD